MPLRDLVLKNRSYRRFHEDAAVERETLLELVVVWVRSTESIPFNVAHLDTHVCTHED